jgi:hypothetical protein
MRIAAVVVLVACGGPERVPQDVVDARAYCELSADVFCPYYLRCGRMAADDLAECRTTFADACEARYEPLYAGLADAGLLALSVEGLGACAAHLRDVDCDDQINDLDGACADVWQGLAPAGAACGIGIESFVCEEGTTCVLDLSLCGTCEPTVAVGSSCVDARCEDGSSCVGDVCVADALPGDPCGDAQACVLGAWCEDGVCARRAVVAVGDDCDAEHVCRYRSFCVGGSCVLGGLTGDACSNQAPCSAGWCDDGTCAAPKLEGAACAGPLECQSGRCDGTCGAIPGACFDE